VIAHNGSANAAALAVDGAALLAAF